LALWQGPESIMRMYLGTDCRADTLLAGCLVAFLAYWDWLPRRPWARETLAGLAGAAIAVLVAHCLSNPDFKYFFRIGQTVMACTVAVLLAALYCNAPRPLAWVLSLPPLAWTGRI